MSQQQSILLYGANGYTGNLIAHLAQERGLKFILAGRDRAKIETLATKLKLPHLVLSLNDTNALDDALKNVVAVLHCAGPFSHTSKPVADACLRKGVHYLDITGEITVFESLAARDAEAKSAGVMLLPGTGFDVVPSDCLAAHLKRRLPSATHLRLGIQGLGRISHGTATTMVENINRGGVIRRDGRLTPVPAAWKTRLIDFGRGPVPATTIPWGDVSTAYHSTGIPNIEVYAAMRAGMRRMMKASRPFGRLLKTRAAQNFLKRRIKAQPAGPNDEERAKGKSFVWGEVWDASGQRRASRLSGPDGYALTTMTALAIATRVLAGDAPAGFQTPSRAYGAEFILEIEGVKREDLADV
jgi:short subunit dehydrogenase-like uncharacterized protein